MKKLISSFKRQKELAFIIASLLILFLLSISPAAASVGDWEFSPQKLVSGDALNIKGIASPGEKIDVFVNFEKTVPVSGGEFEYVLEDVKIPEGFSNSFTVEARGAKKLNVRVKMVLWITKSSEASGGYCNRVSVKCTTRDLYDKDRRKRWRRGIGGEPED